MYPLQSQVLIKKTGVDSALASNLVRGHKSKGAETILYCYANESISVGVDECSKILSTTTCAIAATMDPDEDWQRARDVGRALNIELIDLALVLRIP